MRTTLARYLEYMTDGFYNELVNLQEFEGLSDEEIDAIYALGYNLFMYGKYKSARDIFTGLTSHSPNTGYFWRALGAVNQQLKDYPKAIAAYDMAIAKDSEDVVSFVYRAESQILSGNVAPALRDLEQALKIGADSPEFGAWVERSKILLRAHPSQVAARNDLLAG
jgi:type III secretion system low calcium response chaperone LcrH/SycD